MSGLFFQDKANDLAKKLYIDDFKASNGWVDANYGKWVDAIA